MKALEFNGSGTEYFKIWIVNILLTIITLGIYHPWAKVRNKRYFYGNTELDNANFEYHATGKQLFLSYVIAMCLFLIATILNEFFPFFGIIAMVIFMVAIPWILWRTIIFNLRMSSYRNVRFGFKGSVGGAYAAFLGYPIGLIIVFGVVIATIMGAGQLLDMNSVAMALTGILALFFYPAYFAMINKVSSTYFINGARFGQGEFAAEFSFKTFFGIALKGMGLGILLSILAVVILSLIAYFIIGLDQVMLLSDQVANMEETAEPNPLLFVAIFSSYALLIPISVYVVAYFKARHRTYTFGEMTLDYSINFESTLRANTLFGIYITNFLLLLITLGLAYPWIKVRLYRYSIENITVAAPNGLAGYMSKKGSENAFGEELGDAFDLDVGGIAF